jgi:hypothetical protein
MIDTASSQFKVSLSQGNEQQTNIFIGKFVRKTNSLGLVLH